VGVPVELGVAVAVGLGVLVAAAVGLGVVVAVGLGVPVEVGLGVPVAVGVGVAPAVVPMRRNTWSGSPGGLPTQHCLMPQIWQVGQGFWQPGAGHDAGGGLPPPGFSHAAGEFACPVRSTQNHCPFEMKFM
jgi:hypothetical protein